MKHQIPTRKANQKGGALLWVIFAMMIAVIFLGIIYTVVQNFVNRAAYSRDNRQAYLTARSVCHAVAQVLEDGKDTDFINAVKGLTIGQELELKDFDFQVDAFKSINGSNDPSIHMPQAKARIIKQEENSIKILGEAEIGKGYEQVGLEMEMISGGNIGFYFKEGFTLDNPRLWALEGTDIIIDGHFKSKDSSRLQMNIKDGDLMIRGDVELIREQADAKQNGHIEERLIATGDVVLQSMYIGNALEPSSGIQATGNVFFKSRESMDGQQPNIDTQIYGQIVCNELKIETPITPWKGKIILDADIYANKVSIDGKELSFEESRPTDANVLWVGDYREDKYDSSIVIKGNLQPKKEIEDIPIANEPDWVKKAQSAHKEPVNIQSNTELIGGNYYYVLEGSTVNLDQVKFKNITPQTPVYLIIPEGREQTFTNITEMNMEGGVFPKVNIVVEKNATLNIGMPDLGGEVCAHIYGLGNLGEGKINVTVSNMKGSLIGSNVAIKNDDIKFTHIPSGTEGSGENRFKKGAYVPD